MGLYDYRPYVKKVKLRIMIANNCYCVSQTENKLISYITGGKQQTDNV